MESKTTQEAAAILTRDGVKWGDATLGTSATVTYGFLTAGFGNISMSDGDIALVESALALWADVANITFVRTDRADAQIQFTNYYDPNDVAGGEWSGVVGSYATVRVNLASPGNSITDGYGETLIHEIGHALGLDHPGDYEARSKIPPNYQDDGGYLQDTKQYTVMSYFGASDAGVYHDGEVPLTPLLHDIAAIQRLYGVKTEATRTGDTTYGFHSNANREAFHIDSADDKVVFTIWDQGGTDTLDLSGYSENQTIVLSPGAFTSAGGLRDNIAIAEGVYIENAKGGSGRDLISGNGLSNMLSGGNGDDIIDGRAGADLMYGGLGNDAYIVDNWGDEVVDHEIVRTSLTGPRTARNAGTDHIVTTLNTYTLPQFIEDLSFYGSGDFTGYGNALDNSLVGGAGNDKLFGYNGNDSFDGRQGSDFMSGGAGNDTYVVDSVGDIVSELGPKTKYGMYAADAGGHDTVKTTLSKYTLGMYVEELKFVGYGGTSFEGTGNGWDNVIEGGSGGDILRGMGGNDTLNGMGGADTMKGGADDDTYIVDNVGDVVDEEVQFGTRSGLFSTRYGYKDAGGVDKVITSLSTYDLSRTSSHDSVYLSAGATLFGKIENLEYNGTGSFTGTGNELDNVITGGASADVLTGGGGNDILEGNGGADILFGDAGNDTLKLSGSPSVWLETGRVDGGTGTADTLDLSAVASGVSIDLSAGSWGSWNAIRKTVSTEYVGKITGIENVTGTWHADRIVGDSSANKLSGLGGNDTIVMRGAVGDLGLDTIDGGEGMDTLDFSGLDGSIHIDLGTGKLGMVGDLGAASISGIRSIEHVEGSANDDVIAGSSEDNVIRGGAGVDTINGAGGRDQLDGGAGADIMIGGGDDDQYKVENVGDQIREFAGEGTDLVYTSLGEYTLVDNVENLTSSNIYVDEQDFHGIGNALDNEIHSGNGNDLLEGGAGNDVLASDDFGFSARDTLIGGAGDDTLTGGGAADLFMYRDGDAGHDTITDFNEAEGDRIDFSGVTGATSFASLTTTSDAQGNALLSFGDISMTLGGVVLTSLDGTEFVFAPGPAAPNVSQPPAFAPTPAAAIVIPPGTSFFDGTSAAEVFTVASVNGDFLEINGNAGDDSLTGGDGEEWFDGGEGLNTMAFSGNYSDYTLFENFGGWAGWTMIQNNATGIVDWTMRVENLQFADQQVADPTLNSYISGTSEADTLVGTNGMDVLAGGDGADILQAGGGEDALYIDNFDTLIDGGDGLDVVYVNESANQSGLNFKMAGTNVEHVWSGMGSDTIDARGLAQEPGKWYAVTSHGGDDLAIAGTSNFSFDGGVGEDTLVLAGDRADYMFALPATGVSGLDGVITHTASGAMDYVLSVENFQFADVTLSYSDLFMVG